MPASSLKREVWLFESEKRPRIVQKLFFVGYILLLALVSGILLINLSISGALLIYAKDIQRVINPQYWLVNTEENSSFKPLALSVLVKKIALEQSEKIQLIEQGEKPDHVWQVRLINKQYLNINPLYW